MYIANSKATTTKSNKRIINMLRKERKWNHMKWLVKTKNGRKRVEDNIRTKTR